MNDRNPERMSRQGAIILGGAHGSLEIARSLGRRGIPVWLITADNPLAGLSRYVERSIHWPGPGDDRALGFLVDLARRQHLDGWVLFAGSDADLRFVAQNHGALGAVFALTSPAWETVRWTHDKRQMHARATELGVACPRTAYPHSREEVAALKLDFPVILKPAVREGRNAFIDAKAWRVNDMSALLARYDQARALVGADTIMIQELIPGDGTRQFSYAAIWDRGRPIASLVACRRRQYPIEFGISSTLVETTTRPEVEAAAVRFLSSLDFSGLLEIEFKYDARDAAYKILDVNARAWTWLAMGAAAGIDFPALQWRLATGEKLAAQAAAGNARWLYFSHDLAAAFSEILAGRLSPIAYLRSIRGASACAVFAWDDPWPALLDLPLSAARVAGRRLTRRSHRATSTILPWLRQRA